MLSRITSTTKSLALHRQRGFTLTEVLVTVLVLSIGLLGIAGLHSWSLRNNHDALMRSHASALAGDIADRMRANRQSAFVHNYDIEFTDGAPAADAKDTSGLALAKRDLREWRTRLADQLPGGIGEVLYDEDTRLVTIRIQWGERNVDPEAEPEITFQTQTEI